MARLYSLLIRNAIIAHPDGATQTGDLSCGHERIARIDAAAYERDRIRDVVRGQALSFVPPLK